MLRRLGRVSCGGPFRAWRSGLSPRSNYFCALVRRCASIRRAGRRSTTGRARASSARQPIVAARRRPTGSSPVLRISEIATTATTAPATGVHNPAMRRSAASASDAEATICATADRSRASGQRARERRRRRPVASAASRSLASRRRTLNTGVATRTSTRLFVMAARREAPRGVAGLTLWQRIYSSMIPLLRPMIAACVRSLASSFARMLLTRPLTVSSVTAS